MRLTRRDADRIAASFAGIPTLQAVIMGDENGQPRIIDVEIGEDADRYGKPTEGDGGEYGGT